MYQNKIYYDILLWYHIMIYHIMISYHDISYHDIISCYIISQHDISCLNITYHVLRCYKMLRKSIKCQKISKNDENGPPNGDPFWDTFWPSGPSLLSQASLGSQNDSQGLPKSPRDQSKPQFSSILDGFWVDFGWILWWCFVSCGLLVASLPS